MSLQIISPLSVRLGVVGGGTMGSGIALAALLAEMYVTLFDVSPDVLERAWAYIDRHLTKKDRAANLPRLKLTGELGDLSRCNFVIEAIPEDLALKQELFAKLDALCPPPAILCTNTSTLAVTAIAAASGSPQRVAGMHFFNPAPVLPLVEVVRGAQTAEATLQTVTEVARLMGKTPVAARDMPGFIVNRVARPFYGEALRLLGEQAASVEQIDTIVKLGGGFKMGPFELMDLIGIDINFAAMQSMYDQTFGESRYRPHRIQAQMVQQRALGRKSGRGFYDYGDGRETPQPAAPPQPKPGGIPAEGPVYMIPGGFASGVDELCRRAGHLLAPVPTSGFLALAPPPASVGLIGLGAREGLAERLAGLERLLPPEALIVCQCVDVTLAELAAGMQHPERLAGFDGLFLAAGKAATLAASPHLSLEARRAAEKLFTGLGRLPLWVDDTPGLVLPRIVCMLANEAAFALGDGVADEATIDLAMRLGVSYPYGPLEWARALGVRQVVRVLDHLHNEYGEERYRVAPMLRRWSRTEQ